MPDENPTKTFGDASPDDQLTLDQFGAPILDRTKFDCPQCRSTSFSRVSVSRRNGEPFWLPFYECDGCSVVFTNPWRFKRLVRRSYDYRGSAENTVTRGPDDKPRPKWQRAFVHEGEPEPVGGWIKRPKIDK